jgi:hypothetical protein
MPRGQPHAHPTSYSMGGPQDRSERFRDDTNFLPLPECEPPNRSGRSLITSSILTTLSGVRHYYYYYYYYYCNNTQEDAPGKPSRYSQWTVRGSNPGVGEIFRTRTDQPWGPPSLLYNRYRVFPGGKAAGAWR